MVILKVSKLITLSFLIFVFGNALSQDTDSLKSWLSDDKLKWSNFKGSPPLSETNTMFKAACSSFVIVYPFTEKDSTYYKVRAVFHAYKSWTKDTTKYILAHEQLHFDITELYARKLRKTIKELCATLALDDKKVQDSIKGLISESGKREDDYDKETVHGLLKEHQHEWAKKICGELEQLKKYAGD